MVTSQTYRFSGNFPTIFRQTVLLKPCYKRGKTDRGYRGKRTELAFGPRQCRGDIGEQPGRGGSGRGSALIIGGGGIGGAGGGSSGFGFSPTPALLAAMKASA